MKKGFLIVQLFFLLTLAANAQTSKTGVVLIENGNTALAAGLQAAISNVQTTLILQSQDFSITPFDQDWGTGLEAEFLKRMRKAKGLKDTTAKVVFDHATANEVLKEWMDSTKKLTVIRSARYHRFKRSGAGWSIQLADGKTIKAKVLVNAEKTLGATADVQVPATVNAARGKALNYSEHRYRTSVAASSDGDVLSLYDLFQSDQENLVMMNTDQQSIAEGQAAGATAAYAVFFGKKTSESHLKTIQGELMQYKVPLIPFRDIALTDPNWRAIQSVGVMGVLKGELKNGKLYFRGDQEVLTSEVRQPIKDLFYKAQIWFDDYKADQMTLDATIKLASYIGNKSPQATLDDVKKKWEKNYRFKMPFDLDKPVSRRAFVSILHDYSPPFNVTVDSKGRITR